jgi:hypothetical protein
MRTLMAGILILGGLALGGALLLRAPKPEAASTHPHPASHAPTPRVAQDEGTVPSAVIPFLRYEASSIPVPPAETQEPEVGPRASVEPPALSGIIVGPEGEIVTDPMVVFFLTAPDSFSNRQPIQETQDIQTASVHEGKFQFETLRATEGSLFVRADSMWFQKEPMAARKGDQGLVIPVELGGSISGRVSLSDSGFATLVVRMRHASTGSESLSLVRAADGSCFHFETVPAGFVDIEILLPPFKEVLADIPSVAVRPGRGPDDRRLDPISLPMARRANLRLVDRSGLPLREFTVLSGDQVVERRLWIQGAADVETLHKYVRSRLHLDPRAIVTSDPGGSGLVAYPRGGADQGFASPMQPPLTPDTPVSILLGPRPQALRILAPGYLPKAHTLIGDAVVELITAPSLQVTLDPALPGPAGPAKGPTILTLRLEPESLEAFDAANVVLQGVVDLDGASRTLAIPTLGPGRYRLGASMISTRVSVWQGTHQSTRSLEPCGPKVIDIGPGDASLTLSFDPIAWAAALPP